MRERQTDRETERQTDRDRQNIHSISPSTVWLHTFTSSTDVFTQCTLAGASVRHPTRTTLSSIQPRCFLLSTRHYARGQHLEFYGPCVPYSPPVAFSSLTDRTRLFGNETGHTVSLQAYAPLLMQSPVLDLREDVCWVDLRVLIFSSCRLSSP